MTLIVLTPAGYAPERRYAIDLVLSEWLGQDYVLRPAIGSNVRIRMGDDVADPELSVPDVFFATPAADWLTERSMPSRPLVRLLVPPPTDLESDSSRHELRTLPALFNRTTSDGMAWRLNPAGAELSVDIFGSVFFLVTRYEEAVQKVRDRHGRFSAASSLAIAEDILDRPIADEFVELLWSLIHRLWPHLRRKPSEFQLRLTHDVDQPWSARGRSTGTVVRSIGVDILRRRDLGLAWQRTISLRDARTGRIDRDPFNTFRLLMEISEQHGLRSTFYFLAGNTPTEYDFRYTLSDPVFVPLLREIHERDHEIGLHASYSSYLSSDRIAFEFNALVAVCSGLHIDQADWGVRQHYLRFEVPMTWRSQASAGLGYDSTVGFNDRIGFRAGTCREFPVFDLEQREALALRERPLLVMDVTLMEQLGQGWSSARTEIITICAAARRVNGNAVLLFHNNTLATGYARRQYQDLVHDLVRS